MASILESCGQYSEALLEISKTILETKQESGEEILVTDKEDLDYKLFLGYQEILSIAKDGVTISEAIKNLKDIVISTGRTDFEKIATVAALQAVENEKNIQVLDNDNIRTKPMNKLLDEKIMLHMDGIVKKASEGDEHSNAVLAIIEQAEKFMSKYPTIDDKKMKAALILINRLLVTGNPLAEEKAEEMVMKYGIDVLENEPSSKEKISIDKLESLTKEKVGEKYDRSKMEQINQKMGRRAVEKEQFKSVKDYNQFVENLQFKKRVIEMKSDIENGEINFEGVKSEQVLRNIIDENITYYNLAVEKGKKTNEIEKRLEKCQNIYYKNFGEKKETHLENENKKPKAESNKFDSGR